MTEDKYQITEKSQYINLLILKDEFQYFDEVLSKQITGIESWLSKFRATRGVFLTLNNLKDAVSQIQLNGDSDFVARTRKLRRDLIFANHFRNRGIGHIDNTLLKRAVQWHPQIFLDIIQNKQDFQTVEAQRAIIESCINSFIDGEGTQKTFGTEIDLMYPPDARQFFTYLATLVKESIAWLTDALSILSKVIRYHTKEDVQEFAAIAGQTNFDLKEESDFIFSVEGMKEKFQNVLDVLEKQGVDSELLEFLINGCKI